MLFRQLKWLPFTKYSKIMPHMEQSVLGTAIIAIVYTDGKQYLLSSQNSLDSYTQTPENMLTSSVSK